ncbi:hypothetical protein [Leptotrichia wadei]|jgi:MORN variant repeat protein|uniref:hypothetical protein n=1 Tax=Leptotrichia wadei TaxID=157687 RepID=UPI0028E55F10|nr:hypothetical protein [Leptotrichia wadei]
MKNMNNQELLNSVENEILKHKENYSENQIKELIEIFNEIINVKTENADNIGDRYIDAIGNDHSGTYFFENVWTIDLLIKILENSIKNRARSIFCIASLNELYYFELGYLKELSMEEWEYERKKMKKLLYPYSDKFYDGLLEKYENINSENLNEISDSNKEIEEIKEVENKKNNLKKPIEQTYDSIRDWLLPLLRKDDKIIFPKEEFLERVKLFDEAEKMRTFNVIKSAVEHDNYCVKFEENKTIRGYEVIKAFGEMLGIAVEEEVVEKVEETEVEEEKKLTPQQLRKKYFLKRMKGEDK